MEINIMRDPLIDKLEESVMRNNNIEKVKKRRTRSKINSTPNENIEGSSVMLVGQNSHSADHAKVPKTKKVEPKQRTRLTNSKQRNVASECSNLNSDNDLAKQPYTNKKKTNRQNKNKQINLFFSTDSTWTPSCGQLSTNEQQNDHQRDIAKTFELSHEDLKKFLDEKEVSTHKKIERLNNDLSNINLKREYINGLDYLLHL